MRNQKVSFIQNYFREKVAKLAEQFFHKSLGENGVLKFDVNVVALLVWVKLSWASKTAQKLTLKNPLFSSRLLQVSDSFILNASFKFSVVLLQAAKKVHVYLIHYSVFCSSALFSNAGSKVNVQINLCFWKVLQVFVNFVQGWGYEFAPAGESPASVSDHVMTSQVYTKVEQVETWRFNSSLAIVPTVLIWLLF